MACNLISMLFKEIQCPPLMKLFCVLQKQTAAAKLPAWGAWEAESRYCWPSAGKSASATTKSYLSCSRHAPPPQKSLYAWNKCDFCLTQQQNQELGVQLGTLSHSESDLMETNQRLRETLDRVREELRTARAQAERSQHEAERYICCSVFRQNS